MSTIYWAIVSILCGISARVAEGYHDAYGKWTECPQGYVLMNNLCYRSNVCQDGFTLHTDGLCYLTRQEQCPYASRTCTSTPQVVPIYTTPEPETITEEQPTTTVEPEISAEEYTYPPEPIPSPDELVRCPPGSVFYMEQCRKIICTQGEYYAGRCLSPACPLGTVWRGKRCQQPAYVTTILEIDNVIKNTNEYRAVTENVNNVNYETSRAYNPTADRSYTIPTPPEKMVVAATPRANSPQQLNAGCCTVKTARICRPFTSTWLCFNRSKKLCDPRICTSPVIYLKPPQIVQLNNPQILVMPPNPPMSACKHPDCQESEMLNCSGCAEGERESCSVGCYNYFCPGNGCAYKSSEEFCSLYPGGFGCTRNDGCIWKWCD